MNRMTRQQSRFSFLLIIMGIFHLPTHKSFKCCSIQIWLSCNMIHSPQLYYVVINYSYVYNFMRMCQFNFVNLCTNDKRMYPSPDLYMPIIMVYHFDSFISVCAFVSHVNGWLEVELYLWSECLYFFIFCLFFFFIRFHWRIVTTDTSNRINTVDAPIKIIHSSKIIWSIWFSLIFKMKTFLVSIIFKLIQCPHWTPATSNAKYIFIKIYKLNWIFFPLSLFP